MQISRSFYAYASRRAGQEGLRLRMRELAQARPRFGYRRIHVMLRRDGWSVNMKRVRRLYRLEGLQLRLRVRRRKHASVARRSGWECATIRMEIGERSEPIMPRLFVARKVYFSG
jgi:transposase InsO family protein